MEEGAAVWVIFMLVAVWITAEVWVPGDGRVRMEGYGAPGVAVGFWGLLRRWISA